MQTSFDVRITSYSSTTLDGWTRDQSKEIERIQKRALKIIYKEDDYDKCLQNAELVSLIKGKARPTVYSVN